MTNKYIFIGLLLGLALFASSDAKGGRGGGGGRGGRSSSGRGWGSSRRGSTSSSSSGSFGGSHYGGSNHNGGRSGWFQGMFHSTPQYTYRPVFLTRSSSSSFSSGSGSGNSLDSGAYNTRVEEYDSHADQNYAIGYIISRGLSSDFFSIFNVVHGIAEYPKKIKNKEIIKVTSTTTTTTESPVATYSLYDTFTTT